MNVYGMPNHGCPADEPFEDFPLTMEKIGCPGPSEHRIFEACMVKFTGIKHWMYMLNSLCH